MNRVFGQSPGPMFDPGDHVRIKEGMFAGMEGDVVGLPTSDLARVMLRVYGRDVPVELEYWQIEHT